MKKWIYDNKNVLLIMVTSFFLVVGFIVGIHFFQEIEKAPDISKEPIVLPDQDELEFSNDSSMSVEEIWNLVEAKKKALYQLFYDSKVYEPHEIDPKAYTVSDNDVYVVFDQDFIKRLNNLVTDSIYYSFFEKMTMIKEQFYIAEKDIFEDIYLNSVITEIDVLSSEVRLISANEEMINASVLLQMSNTENQESFHVPFELQKVDNNWKISAFLRN